MKVGAVTIGQAPRVDVMPDILPILGEDVELIQMGGLDGLSKEEIAKLVPKEGDYFLVSRLNDGTFAKFSESYVYGRMQEEIYQMEAAGVQAVMVMCAGDFPQFDAHVPVIYPAKVLDGLAAALSPRKKMVLITPDEQQIEQGYKHWGPFMDVTPFAANPYGIMQEVVDAANKAKDVDCDVIVMDCIGYTAEARRIVAHITGKPVLLCRTVLARTVCEIIAGMTA